MQPLGDWSIKVAADNGKVVVTFFGDRRLALLAEFVRCLTVADLSDVARELAVESSVYRRDPKFPCEVPPADDSDLEPVSRAWDFAVFFYPMITIPGNVSRSCDWIDTYCVEICSRDGRQVYISKPFFFRVISSTLDAAADFLAKNSGGEQLIGELRAARAELLNVLRPLPENTVWSVEHLDQERYGHDFQVGGDTDPAVNKVLSDLLSGLDPASLVPLLSDFVHQRGRGHEFFSIHNSEELFDDGHFLEPNVVDVRLFAAHARLSETALRSFFALALPMYLNHRAVTPSERESLTNLASSFARPLVQSP